jgi:amino acid transporter
MDKLAQEAFVHAAFGKRAGDIVLSYLFEGEIQCPISYGIVGQYEHLSLCIGEIWPYQPIPCDTLKHLQSQKRPSGFQLFHPRFEYAHDILSYFVPLVFCFGIIFLELGSAVDQLELDSGGEHEDT